ncbi:MAG: Polyribonucleotide nucleotidyltransferase [Parcubacteria group bacterium GW2011_GWD2_35_7]|nr:MAG: Polyribonucleotide nucleotidyltransferase [Parcubacteria group bacterium GW2011_GWD2_35_7]
MNTPLEKHSFFLRFLVSIYFVDTKKYTHTLEGKTFTVELNNWAQQASGSVLVRLGDTLVLATAVASPKAREGTDFFPLTVDYEEKYYAAGKILGSRFIKRETRPSDEAILVMRLVDRTIRPRFSMGMRNDVQVVITALSVDGENDPDVLAGQLGADVEIRGGHAAMPHHSSKEREELDKWTKSHASTWGPRVGRR